MPGSWCLKESLCAQQIIERRHRHGRRFLRDIVADPQQHTTFIMTAETTRVAILTVHDLETEILAALSAGADALVRPGRRLDADTGA